MNNPQNSFRTGLLKLAFPYARLVALSYGFQHAFGKNHTDENPFLLRVCMITFVLNAYPDDRFTVLECSNRRSQRRT
jgi:hypothetical protein